MPKRVNKKSIHKANHTTFLKMDKNNKGSILAQLMAEEEDNQNFSSNSKSKSDLDFITMLNNNAETIDNNNSQNVKDNNPFISNKNDSEMYVNKGFTFGNNTSVSNMTPPSNNLKDHSRKSSLNYTPNKINPPPFNLKSNNNSPTNTFRKAHRYKHSSVSINYNELLNITNKLEDEDDEKIHILVNKYLEFPTVKKVLNQFTAEQTVETGVYIIFMLFLSYLPNHLANQESNIKHVLILTLQTLIQTSLFTHLSKSIAGIITHDDFYKLYNFQYPFGFLRFNVIQEYSTNLYNCYTVMNLFFEILEITMYGGDVHTGGGHGHTGHQHDKEFEPSGIEKRDLLEQSSLLEIVILMMIIGVMGYKKNQYCLIMSFTWLSLILFDGGIVQNVAKLVMIGCLFTYLITNIKHIVNNILKYLNMSNVYDRGLLYSLKNDIDNVLMTDKYSLKISDLNNHTCMVLIKVESDKVNVIDIDIKKKVHTCVQNRIKNKDIMLTVEL